MSYLIDTGVLLRAFDATSPQRPAVRQALRVLIQRREVLLVSVQNMAEFWNVATRPLVNNGQGLSPSHAERRLRLIERFCQVIAEDLKSYEI